MSTQNPTSIEIGQFDNAIETAEPRGNGHFIDDALESSETSSESDEEESEDLDEVAYDNDRVEDEDWEIAERDFTKQYNRLRQHVAVRTGNAQGITSSTNRSAVVAALPAVNHPRDAAPIAQKDKTADQLAALAKYSSRISKIDQPYVMGVGVNRKGPSSYANAKDKSDRATSEQVLDPRTRIILFKMIGRGLVQEINGCVSTGKEANVYHAITPESSHLALKIYKTSILVFKDRDRYVTGEYRFRRGYSRHNPRKMVRMWAEKEMRNLKRLVSAGIYCPEPVEVRENVLVMKFLGDKEGWASPRLKDAEIPSAEYPSLYQELVLSIRRMFHQCKLVHADLSEYNILYHDSHLYIIDVSQSVEHDHPSAFDFLRKDIKNVEEFFGRFGVKCLGLRRCFEFITREKGAEGENQEDDAAVLVRCLSEADEDESLSPDPASYDDPSSQPTRPLSTHEDSVFLQSYIPRSLNEVYDPERDIDALARGDGRDLIYADTIGLIEPLSKQSESIPQVHFDVEENPEDDSESDSTDDDAEPRDPSEARTPRGHRHEDRDAKKERKKAVKAEAKEKRKNKIPKAEKKRKIKNTRH
ncbi:RIO1-domain-containing protein [Hygrophoropsis aurantiaca]|uniref:RIO1-domain-containing protein n=1 Tax=Hygrophoropsis aurantiaca TaxID=72124 RepID=A0ACB8A4R3_9AGAM|nr:RIO1-domain-containing protein [Hygrophoropsis aurantiaca]